MEMKEFVAKHEIGIQSTRIAARPDEDREWKAFHYSVTLTRGATTMTTQFRMGLGHVEKGKPPANCWCGGDTTNKAGRPVWWDAMAQAQIEGRPKLPTAESVLDSLRSDTALAVSTFEDFCADLGYSLDSRKALEMYLACQNAGTRLRVFLGEIYAEFLTCDSL